MFSFVFQYCSIDICIYFFIIFLSAVHKMFWDFYSDTSTDVPSICLQFLDNTCTVGNGNCQDVHTKYPFLWQSQLKGEWCNLSDYHNIQLEEAYRIVHNSGVQLSATDPNNGKVFFDNAQDWYVNFDKMCIQHGNSIFQIRRLSTQSAVSSTCKLATNWEW